MTTRNPAAARTYRNRSRTELDILVGEFLAERRVSMNMTQTEVAEEWTRLAGSTRSQVAVSNYETARAPLTLSQCFQVCQVLSLSPQAVLNLGTGTLSTTPAWTVPRLELPPVSDRPRVQ